MLNGDAVITSCNLRLVLTSREAHDFRMQMTGGHLCRRQVCVPNDGEGLPCSDLRLFGVEAEVGELSREVVRVVKLAEENEPATDLLAC